jgi:hypothetical protein
VVGREDGRPQGDNDDATMDDSVQGCMFYGGSSEAAGGPSKATCENYLERVYVGGCSEGSKLGGVGSGKFINFWRGGGC